MIFGLKQEILKKFHFYFLENVISYKISKFLLKVNKHFK